MPKTLRVELCFANERVVVARKRHPLGRASSLAELVDSEWMLTGLRERESQEYEELFGTYGLPAPKARTRVESPLGLPSILGATDALVLLPRQWTDTLMFRSVLQEIPVREKLMAPDIVLVSLASVPLTPLAEKMAVFLQRASATPVVLPAVM